MENAPKPSSNKSLSYSLTQIKLDVYYYTLTWDKLRKVFEKFKLEMNSVLKPPSTLPSGFATEFKQIKTRIMKLLIPISRRELEIYCLTLPCGPNFEPYEPIDHWKSNGGNSVGAVLYDQQTQSFAVLVLRRRTDHRFVKTHYQQELKTHDEALAEVAKYVNAESAPEPLPSGEPRRALLLKPGKGSIGDHFKLLTGTVSHYPA